jgi:hypothetical protein
MSPKRTIKRNKSKHLAKVACLPNKQQREKQASYKQMHFNRASQQRERARFVKRQSNLASCVSASVRKVMTKLKPTDTLPQQSQPQANEIMQSALKQTEKTMIYLR